MQNTILVPLDGSALAEQVLPHAARAAVALSAKLTLLRAVVPVVPVIPFSPVPRTSHNPPRISYGRLAEAESYLVTIAARLSTPALPVDTVVCDTDPVAAIGAYSAAHPEVVLVALATHGYGGLRELVMGSVAVRVMQQIRAPLLLLRPAPTASVTPAAAPTPYRTILVPVDSSPYSTTAVDQACLLAAPSGATVLLVTLVDTPGGALVPAGPDPVRGPTAELATFARVEAHMATLARRVTAHRLPVQTRIMHDLPVTAIARAADEADADLIVMISHARRGWSYLRQGSVALDVVRNTARPVLITRRELAAPGGRKG